MDAPLFPNIKVCPAPQGHCNHRGNGKRNQQILCRTLFLSPPNFPTNYWQFCRELKNNGLNVLGIGDQPYEELKPELKASLNEYYKVNSLENYDEVYRAVAFFRLQVWPHRLAGVQQ